MFGDNSVADGQVVVCSFGDAVVVGDDDHGQSAGVELFDELEDLVARGAVEIAGWFVAQHQ